MSRKKATLEPFEPRKLPRSHAALSILVPFLFQRLQIGLTLVDGRGWHCVNEYRPLIEFEDEYGVQAERIEYNVRSTDQAARTQRTTVARTGDLTDLFVPIVKQGHVDQMLVAGPFQSRPATSAGILEGWRRLTGRRGHLNEPEFGRYAAARLATVYYDATQQELLTQMLERIAQLVAGAEDAEAALAEIHRAREVLGEASFAPRMWNLARAIVDPTSSRAWSSPWKLVQRAELGINGVPERALVALMVNRQESGDPLEDMIRRDAFLRACVALSRTHKDCVCGRIGDHGMMLLAPAAASETRTRSRLMELSEKVVALARRFQLRLHVGISPGQHGAELPANFQAGLAAAEEALSRGVALVDRSRAQKSRVEAPRELRRGLSQSATAGPLNLVARFDRYLESAAAQSGYRLEPIRLHLEVGFERIVEPYVSSGIVSVDRAARLYESLRASAESAQTVNDLFEAYRGVLKELEQHLQDPSQAHREVSLSRAVEWVQERLGEPLSLADAARVAGFAPNYFSRLFKEREGVPFKRFLLKLRVEQAKGMLGRTTVSVEQVARACGFSSGPYFHRAFKRMTGKTPMAFRHTARRRLPGGGTQR